MKPKFEIGDRVIYKPQNYIGTIKGIDRDTNGYSILYDDGEECYVRENELEFENPKLVFLTRLQELLATFDAEISNQGMYEIEGAEITLGNGDKISYPQTNLTAENVFDYDKE